MLRRNSKKQKNRRSKVAPGRLTPFYYFLFHEINNVFFVFLDSQTYGLF